MVRSFHMNYFIFLTKMVLRVVFESSVPSSLGEFFQFIHPSTSKHSIHFRIKKTNIVVGQMSARKPFFSACVYCVPTHRQTTSKSQ